MNLNTDNKESGTLSCNSTVLRSNKKANNSIEKKPNMPENTELLEVKEKMFKITEVIKLKNQFITMENCSRKIDIN